MMSSVKPGVVAPVKFAALGALALVLAGCVSNQPRPEDSASTANAVESKAEPLPTPAPAAASKPVCPEKPVTKSSKTTSKTSTSKTTSKTSTKTTSKTAATPAEPDCVPASKAAAPTPAPAAKSAEPAPVVAKAAGPNGYDLSRNKPVTDSTKVEAGQGTPVKGINDWEGEITGVPASGSRFPVLRIGMPQQQVMDLIGRPTDQGAYVTGKAFIPFYYGSDKTRWEMVYKGQGRLIFSNQAGFGTGYYLTWIIHNASEPGYR